MTKLEFAEQAQTSSWHFKRFADSHEAHYSEDIQQIQKHFHQQGYDKGYQAGMIEGQKRASQQAEQQINAALQTQLATQKQQLETLIQGLATIKQTQLSTVSEAITEVIAVLSKKLIQQAIAVEPALIQAILADLQEQLLNSEEHYKIQVSEADFAFLSQHNQAYPGIQFEVDGQLSQGDVRLANSAFAVDGTLEARIAQLLEHKTS